MERDHTTRADQPDAELSVGQFLGVFWRGRWIIAGAIVLAAGLGWAYVARRGDIWRAKAELFVQSPRVAAGGLDELLSTFGVDNVAHKQAHLLRSDLILERALEGDEELGRAPLRSSPIFPESVPEIAKVEWLRGRLETSVGQDDEVIRVSLDHADQQLASDTVNAVVDTFADYVLEQRSDTAEDFLNRYDQEVTTLQGEAEELRSTAEALIAAHDLDPDGLVLHRLSDGLRRAEAELEETREQIEAAEAAQRRLADHPPDTPVLRAMARAVQELETERTLLRSRFTERHPAVQRLELAVDAAREQLAQEQAAALTVARAELDFTLTTARARRERLAERIDRETARYKDLNRHYVEFLELRQRTAMVQKLLETRFAKIRELNVARIGTEEQAFGVEVRNRPMPGRLENVSGRMMRLGIAVLLGAVAGAFLAWLREALDQRLRSAEEAAGLLRLPMLGSMPHVDGIQGAAVVDADGRWNTDRIFSEAARSLRTQVFFGLPADQGRVLHVTSADQGEGKSTTIANLAVAMAKAGQRTLLIDADLRRPRQHRLFGLEQGPGLSEYLSGHDGHSEPALVATAIENLTLLAAGAVPPNPAEILNDRRFEELLRQLGRDFDRVLVDSPPVLPVADASILGPRCDATILVLRAEHSTRKRAKAAKDSLDRVGARVLGLVINDVPQHQGYYRRRYGDHGYGYYVDHYLDDEHQAAGGGVELERPSGAKRKRRTQSAAARARVKVSD